MRFVSVVTTLLMMTLTVTPVAANSKDDGDRARGRWEHHREEVFKNSRDEMSNDAADRLSDVFQDCLSHGNVREMRWMQIREIVRALGLSPQERDDLRRHGDLGDLADTL